MDSASLPNAPRALLIDLDNCPSRLAQLPLAVVHFHRVVVCYGGFEPKIHLSQVALLAPALVEGRLAIEPMDRKGKNAADFGLTFWAGRLLAEMTPDTEFLVLSRDSDLDYLIDMLRRAGRKAERLDGNTYPEFGAVAAVQEAIAASPVPDVGEDERVSALGAAVEDYRAVHITGRRTRPARRLTLLNSIRAHCKGNALIDSDAVLQELIRRGVLTVGRGGQVIYRDRLRAALPQAVPLALAVPAAPEPVAAPVSDRSEAVEMGIVDAAADVALEQLPTVQDDALVAVLPVDEYYAAHIADQRNRPGRRIALLNSLRTYFNGRPEVDPEGVMAELFQRGVIFQSRTGQIRYRDRTIAKPAVDLPVAEASLVPAVTPEEPAPDPVVPEAMIAEPLPIDPPIVPKHPKRIRPSQRKAPPLPNIPGAAEAEVESRTD